MSGDSKLPILGYWDIRGRGEPLRYLLAYAEAKYVDKRYTFKNVDEWFKQDKLKLGLDFPNLPYFIDGNVKLTQSLAILRYLGRKFNLSAETDNEQRDMDVIQEQVTDLRASLRGVCANDNFEEAKTSYLKQGLPKQLELLEKFFTSANREFVAGKRLTYVDFYAYEVLDTIQAFAPELFVKYPALVAYVKRIESLPAIQKHQNSKTFTRHKRMGPILKWGYSETE